MASRSFKPASYLGNLASAPSPRSRPAFARTSSSGSHGSGEDCGNRTVHLERQLRQMSIDRDDDWDNLKSEPNTPVGSVNSASNSVASSFFHDISKDSPTRKRSDPIPIKSQSLPKRSYTPLSARGDISGGYFPFHAEHDQIERYQPHPFTNHRAKASEDMSASPSLLPSPSSDTTPRTYGSLSPNMFALSPAPESMMMTMGKYHPSVYKSPAPSTGTTPTSAPRLLPPTSLTIPPLSSKRGTKERPGHKRQSSDVQRQIEQYQRDMVVRARSAATTTSSMTGLQNSESRAEPISPRLLPAGSPGPITPFELEESAREGYLVAGTRGRGNSLITKGLGAESQRQMVNHMVSREQERYQERRS